MVIWKIVNLERELPSGTVVTVHWTAALTDGGHTVGRYGSANFSREADEPGFIPFEELTEEIVIGWVTNQMGELQVTALENSLAGQIAEIQNPTKTDGLPWV
jgi:hypothetical protein